jgi:serine/threonine protein kinase
MAHMVLWSHRGPSASLKVIDMLPPASQPSLSPGTGDIVVGGRYRLVRRLGKGGMGEVFEAENTWTRRRVALKVMRPEHANNTDLALRFRREAQASTQLAHPNIVDVLDMGEDADTGSLFIVQELLAGHDLRVHLSRAVRMPPRELLSIMFPVMDALATAHAAQVVHRDLKPDNIFLAETSRGLVPKLIDFGIARVQEGLDEVSRTQTGALLGTPTYMAPEQARGDVSIDCRADIWSLGVVMYEALAGKVPYQAPNVGVLLAKIIYEEPIPLGLAAPDLPADLVTAVMGALRRNPDQRHASMRAFEIALRACEAAQDLGAPRLVAPTMVSLAPHASLPGTLAPQVEHRPARSSTVSHPSNNRRWMLGLALSIGVAAMVLFSWRSTPAPSNTADSTQGVVLPASARVPVAAAQSGLPLMLSAAG